VDPESAPSRSEFLANYAGETGEEKPKGEPEPEEEPEGGPEEEPEGKTEEEPEGETEEEPEGEPPQEEENVEEDAEVVPLDDLVGTDTEEVPEGFNPKKGLPSKQWKKLPDYAREFITHQQRYTKRLLREREAEEPLTKWAKSTVEAAESSGMSADAVAEWLDLGMRVQSGDAEAAAKVAERAQQAGYEPPTVRVGAPDLGPVATLLREKVTDLSLADSEAKDIMAKIKQAVEDAPGEPEPAPAPKPAPPPTPAAPTQDVRVQRAALETITEMEDRLAERYGAQWDELQRKISRELILETSRKGHVAPQFWPERYRDVAQKVQKEYLQARKSEKKRTTQTTGSQELGGGSPAPSARGEDTPRDRFLRKYT
jgi:hypothetical protein